MLPSWGSEFVVLPKLHVSSTIVLFNRVFSLCNVWLTFFFLSLVVYGNSSQIVRIEIKPIKNFSNILRKFGFKKNRNTKENSVQSLLLCLVFPSVLMGDWIFHPSALSSWVENSWFGGMSPTCPKGSSPFSEGLAVCTRSSCAGCSSIRSWAKGLNRAARLQGRISLAGLCRGSPHPQSGASGE